MPRASERWGSDRRAPLFLDVLHLVLTLPAGLGSAMDDHVQRNVLLRRARRARRSRQPGRTRRYHRGVSEPFDEEAWERIFAALRHLRNESGPVTLSEEYLELVRRVEDLPQNQSGTDKTWVHDADRAAQEHFRQARLVR